jgi:Tfp pilus assembly protein PilV
MPPFTTRPRAGFTLVELLVALVLTDLALLALVGSGAAVVRELGAGVARAAAINAARSRLEWLAAAPCTPPNNGSALTPAGAREIWQSEISGRTRQLQDSVVFAERGRLSTVVLRTRASC